MERLVKKAQKGNWQAFLQLTLDRKDMLYHKALTLMQNEHDAADAVEEAILKAYGSIQALREPRYFHTWLTRILIHTCLDIQRKAKKTIYLEPELLERGSCSPQEDLADKLDLQEQMAKLDEDTRTILTLRYFADYKLDEIAEIASIPVGTVKSRIYYGLKKLKKSMEGVSSREM